MPWPWERRRWHKKPRHHGLDDDAPGDGARFPGRDRPCARWTGLGDAHSPARGCALPCRYRGQGPGPGRPQLDVAVPDWRISSPELIAYPLLPGTPGLSEETDGSVTWHVDIASPAYAASLGEVVAQLHAIDAAEAPPPASRCAPPPRRRGLQRDPAAPRSSRSRAVGPLDRVDRRGQLLAAAQRAHPWQSRGPHPGRGRAHLGSPGLDHRGDRRPRERSHVPSSQRTARRSSNAPWRLCRRRRQDLAGLAEHCTRLCWRPVKRSIGLPRPPC